MKDKLIDIEEIFYLFKKKIWILVIITIITTGLGVYKASKMVNQYQGSMKVFVGKSENLLDYYPEKEIQYYSEFMNIFNEIIRVDDFLNDTLEKNNINKTAAEVKGGIGISASEKSPIFTITYTSLSDDNLKEVLTAVSNEFSEYIQRIVPETNPKVIDEVRIFPITPNKKKLVIVAFAVGIIISIGIIFVLDYLDDTIKNKDRLEEILPIPVIGEVPKHEKSFKGE